MVTAIDLLHQGRNEELWQMCCGFLRLDINGFMEVQERLLLQQLELLNNSPLGAKVMKGARPKTMEEFRRLAPLTTYKDYCPELQEKREDVLPGKPELWAHSSGWSGEFPEKWVPLTADYIQQLSINLFGVGLISCCQDWGETSMIPDTIKILYSVAPKPYISGTFADVLRKQSPIKYLPTIEEAASLPFDERIKLGFQQALYQGLDYFFGLSLVLVAVGEKFNQSSKRINLRPFIAHPGGLWRLGKGIIKSRLAGRQLLPKDIWSLKGIIGSGVDSVVYKEKIKELWGRYPLDLYSCTEGSVIATQAWDYNGMTFFPNLNFLEFIPEDEQLKYQMDRSYQPKTLLMNEVKAGEKYEIVITNFYGGMITRYRIGDMIKITSLHNDKLGIEIPQMAFERRVDDFIDFYVVILTEKSIWQAIEKSDIPYEDWVAFKDTDNMVLNIGIELKEGYQGNKENIAVRLFKELAYPDNDKSTVQHDDLMDIADFKVQVNLLPKGTFASYSARRQAENADPAHLKVPHVNPPQKVLAMLTAEVEETIVVTKTGVKVQEKSGLEKVNIS